MIDCFVVILIKRTFKGYSEEQRMIKLDECIFLSERKTLPGRFCTNLTKTFGGIKKPHGKHGCLECDIRKKFSDCVTKAKLNGFTCGIERAFITWLNLVRQKKT